VSGGQRHRIDLLDPVPADLAGELARRIFFLSDRIADYRLVREDDGRVVAVVLEAADRLDADRLSRQLRDVVVREVLTQRAAREKVTWRSAAVDGPVTEVFGDMLERGIAVEAGEGQVVLGGPMPALIDGLDARLSHIAGELGATERRYPTLLPTWVLRQAGYLSSFPQHVMFATRLHADADGYRRFAEHPVEDLAGREVLDQCAGVDYCLPPTMCFHTFHELAGRALPSTGMVVTAQGKSFRHESRYRRTLERLWDFTIRETVFLGDREFVLDQRQRFMDAAFALVDELGLNGHCEVANDPFFSGQGTGERILSQRLLELKYELRLRIGGGGTLAVGSFNFHERLFGEGFGIHDPDGATAHSACVGFGLERLAYAFACRHGLDPGAWPADLRPAATVPR
jgi:seryl-tRNA synthetase